MQLLYISTFMFHQEMEETYAFPSCSDAFFAKYLTVFDSVRVLGEKMRGFIEKSALVKMESEQITVRVLLANTHPRDFINDRALKKALTEEIKKADAILIKPPSRRGIMAIKLAEKYHKPYMIELTGDIHNALLQSPSRLKRMYAPLLYRKSRKAIANCRFGLYVSEEYLQSKYPIPGVMCGCSDVVLDRSEPQILEKRLEKIDKMQDDAIINIALIGFYQGNGKGVDTALRALARLPERFHLSVLGNGTAENREKWYTYAENCGVKAERLHFPAPLPSAQAVLHWLDDFDFFVLPSRSEGFGRVIAEAMSRGIPCFATNICTIPEMLSGDALFELDDDETLAARLAMYASDKQRMKAAATHNFHYVKKYDADVLKKRRDAFLIKFKEYCLEKAKN